MSFPVDRPPRVLMFAPAFAPNYFSEALVNSKLALAILDAGSEVVVYSTSSGGEVYSSGWDEPWKRLSSVRKVLPEQHSGLALKAARLRAAIRTGHPIGSAYWAECTARAALKLHSERPFDVILSRSTSCIAHLPAMLFSNALGNTAPVWIANWNDPPDYLFPLPYQKKLSLLQRVLKDRYLRAAASMADINTFPSEQLRDYMTEPLGMDKSNSDNLKRSLVVPHIGMGWQSRPTGISMDPSRFRICHAGNLSSERDPTLLFKAFAKFVKRHPEIRCEIEVIGVLDPVFEAVVAGLGLDDLIHVVDGMPFINCLKRLAEADLQVLIEAPCERGIFLPSKLTDYIEVGQPILALSPRVGAVRDLIERYKFGVFASNDSEVEIEAALEVCLEQRRRSETKCSRKDFLASMAELVRPGRIVEELWQAAARVTRND